MKGLFVLFLLVGSGLAGSVSRWRRNLLEFDDMISCITGRTAILDYNGYGCWCGKGGEGDPVDETDLCCKVHDYCYRGLLEAGTCSSWDLYIESYNFHSSDCGTPDASVTCESENNECEAGLCECDKTAVLCYRNSAFHEEYKNYWNWWYC